MFPLESYFLLAYQYYPEMDLVLYLYCHGYYFVQLVQALETLLADVWVHLVYFLDLTLAEDPVGTFRQ